MIKIEMNKKIDLKKVNDKEYKIKIDFEVMYNIYNMVNIINFIKSNNMLKNFDFTYKKHYMHHKNNKYNFEIFFEFKDICTLKYCKDYEYILYQYIQQFFKEVYNDYDSKINMPSINVLM